MTVDSFKYLSVAPTAIIKSMISRAPRDAAPWTPLRRPLGAATVTLVSLFKRLLDGDLPPEASRRDV